MNYFGSIDAKVSDALGQHPGAHLFSESVHATHAPADAVVVPDAQLLFNAEFKRAGVDLVLTGEGREFVLHDYFKGAHRAAIASPDGAHLTGDLVKALAGEVQYAQADGTAEAHKVIGHVTKLVGSATAMRNGVSIILNNGDNVEKGDVVSSGSDSTLGITFIDGTVFGLSSNARMVLNEMVYDPNGSNNSSLLSLVAGTITFVAGETAKHGDMKVDTPVATMGIRGTAVLVEIDFAVPPQNADPNLPPAPNAKFQVLVEPDGTTGSYILFDKQTLTPLAVVDTAGHQINISNGILSQTLAPLSPEIQKLITDVFSLKFSDSSNTKTLDHFTDSIVPTDGFGLFKFGSLNTNAPPIPIIVNLVVVNTADSGSGGLTKGHIPDPPIFQQPIANANVTELTNTTGSKSLDQAGGLIQYFDVNATDHDTVSVKFSSFTYQNAKGVDVSGSLNSLQLADIAKVEATIGVAQPFNLNSDGTATAIWNYNVQDHAFDFLAAGEKLTLTYTAKVDNNYQPLDQSSSQTFTITITGTNDAPNITSSQQNINFVPAGTDTKGGQLIPDTTTSGKLAFTDVDLTDTHTVAVKMASALLDGKDLSATVGQVVIDELGSALTAKITAADDSTGTGAGTIEWTLADLQVYLADVVPANETLVLTYAVTVTDSQGATSIQDVVVTIGGNQPAATVWIDTDPRTPANEALWQTAANWENDRTPAITDDVFIGTDQVLPSTPTFPVTVDVDAQAKSLTMDYFTDFGTSTPELDVEKNVTLEIAGALKLDTSTDAASPLTAESIIKNWGNITIGDIAELLKNSVLDNYGTFYLAKGGEFAGQSSITNSGLIEIASETLDVTVDIVNSAITPPNPGTAGVESDVATGGTIQVDTNAKLLLSDGGGIIGGKLTIADGGTVEVAYGQGGTVAANGATLDGVQVTNGGTIQVDGAAAANPEADPPVVATPAATLTLDDGTTIKGGDLTIDEGATLDIEAGTSGPGATLDGVTVTGTSDPSTIAIGSTATLLLDDNTTITHGNLTIVGDSTLDVEAGKTGQGASLHGVAVSGTSGDSHSIIEIGNSGAATLLLDDGTTIKNGNLTIAGASILDVEAGTTEPGAALDGVTVIGANATEMAIASTIEVGAAHAATLLLDDGTSITNGNMTISAGSAVDVESGSGATLDGVTVNGVSAANPAQASTIAVGEPHAATLAVEGGTTIINGDLNIGSGSTLDVEAGGANPGATLDGVTVTGTDADAESSVLASTIAIGKSGAATLLLDDDTTITGGDLTIASGATLDIETGTTGLGATLDGVTVIGTSDPSTIAIGSDATLLLDDGTTITNGDLTIASGGTLDVGTAASGPGATLDAVAVSGTNDPSLVEVGAFGATTLLLDDGTTITNGDLNIIGPSTLDIEAGKTGPGATLDDVTVHGTDAIDLIAASLIEVGHSGVTTLTLDGGTRIINGDLTIASGSTLDIESGTGATLDGVTVTGTSDPSTIEVGISGPTTLTIEDGTTITNGNLTIADGASVDVAAGTTGAGATLDGVTVSGDVTVEPGITLTLNTDNLAGVTLSGGTDAATAVTVSANSEIDNATITGGITVNSGKTLTLDTDNLAGVTLSGGTDAATAVTVSANSEIDNATVTGGITVNSGKTLTLNTDNLAGVTLSGGTDAATAVTVSANSEIDNATITGDITVNSGKTLTLDGGTTIVNGDLTIANGSTLDIESSAGATLDDVNVTNNGTIQVDIPGGTPEIVNLVLDDGTKITGGKLLINPLQSGVEGAVEIGAGGATFDNVTVTNNILTIDPSVVLTIDDNTSITGGTIDDNGTLLASGSNQIKNAKINGGGTGLLEEELGTLTFAGAIALDALSLTGKFSDSGSTVTLDDIVTFNTVTMDGGSAGGAIDDTGTMSVAAASEIANNSINGGGSITTGSASLAFDNVSLSNLTLSGNFSGTFGNTGPVTFAGVTITSGTIDNAALLVVTASSEIEDATLNGGGTIDIGTAKATDVTLTLDHGASMSGGKLVFGGSSDKLDIGTGGATLTNVAVSGGGEIDVNSTLTVNGTTITGGTLDISGTLDSEGASFITSATINNSSNIDIVSGTLTIDPTTFTNKGTVDVQSASTLVLFDQTVANSFTSGETTTNGLIQVDHASSTSFGTLDLESSTINGGALTVAGHLNSTGSSTIDVTTFTNTGTIDVQSGKLTVDGAITNGTSTTKGAIDIDAGGHLEITGAVTGQTVDFTQANGGGLLILDDSHHFQGTIAGLVEASFGSDESAENKVDLTDFAFPTQEGQHISVSASSSGGGGETVTVTTTTTDSHHHVHQLDSVTLHLSGSSSGSFEVHADGSGGTILDDPATTGIVTVDSRAVLGISAASSATIDFTNSTGTTGELLLNDSKDFTGTIAGFAGDGTTANSDLIDVSDINFANVATDKTTYTEHADGTGTLTLYNASGQALDSLNFTGNYQLANFIVEGDGNGGTLIVDPPVNNPAPAGTVVATAANQTLAGSAPSDNFVFNFPNVGQSTVSNFHALTDALQLGHALFANAETALNAAHDDGHGNTVLAIDAHDSITLTGVAKSQLHVSDFHIV